MPKVCIIGRGLAGSFAALAAKNKGADTTVVYKGLGLSALLNGLISIATPNSHLPLYRGMEILFKHRPYHPYKILENPLDAILSCKELFTELLGDIYGEFPTGETCAGFFPNDLGTFSRADMAPETFWKFEPDKKAGIIKLASYPLFRSDYLAESFNAFQPESELKTGFSVVETGFDKNGKLFKNAADLARFLDDDKNIEHLAQGIKDQKVDDLDYLLFPAALGFKRFDVADKLSELIGCKVKEVCSAQNSTYGLKLAKHLKQRLTDKGVEFIHGEACGYTGGDTIRSIDIKLNEQGTKTLEADAFVLAGGKFIGGGIVCTDKFFREPLFNSRVSIGKKDLKDIFIGRLTEVKFDVGQRFAEAGLTINGDFNICDIYKTIYFPNLFAAGQILKGFDPFSDGCSQGVDILSGIVAGQNAAEVRS